MNHMAHEESRQFHEALGRAKSVLVAFRKDADHDAAATAVAIGHVLRARGKTADVVGDGYALPKALGFLPGGDAIKAALGGLQTFTVRIDTARTAVGALSYDKKDGSLDIVLTPKQGQFSAKDVTTHASPFKYDLVITVGAPDLASLGAPYTAHPDLFFERPVVNIDNDAGNEHYGAINAVDIGATSCAEIAHRLFSADTKHFLTPEVATCLLTGVIARTKSFRTANVTPRTLEIASELMAAGAKRAEIVDHLYRTRPLEALKLWGRALARLKYDPAIRMTWTVLVRQDFVHAGTTEEHLPEVIDELIANTPDAEIIGVLFEQESKTSPGRVESICGLVSSERHADALGLVRDLKPEGTRRLARLCFMDTRIQDAERMLVDSVYRSLGKTPPAHLAHSGSMGIAASASPRLPAG